jgi:hypothetical protein
MQNHIPLKLVLLFPLLVLHPLTEINIPVTETSLNSCKTAVVLQWPQTTIEASVFSASQET